MVTKRQAAHSGIALEVPAGIDGEDEVHRAGRAKRVHEFVLVVFLHVAGTTPDSVKQITV